MNKKQIVLAIDAIHLPEDRKQAMLVSILNGAMPETKITAAQTQDRKKAPVRKLRWAIPTAAACIALITLLMTPNISMALSNWFSRLFRVDEYVSVLPEDRSSRPDVDAVIQTPGPTQDYSIALLSESEQYGRFDELRLQEGFEAYVPSDWAFLKDADAEIYDILFDGNSLIVTSFLHTDPIPFYAPAQGGLWMDWIADGATIANGNGDIQLMAGSTGTRPQADYYDEGRTPNMDAISRDGGVYLITEFDMSGIALDTGEYTMTLCSHILDCHVDTQGDLATVAFLEQRFTLEVPSSSLPQTQTGIRLSGTHILTVQSADTTAETFYNQALDLTGVRITPKVTQNVTNILVELTYTFPEDWTAEQRQALIDGRLHKHDGLRYELLIDGQSVGMLSEEKYAENSVSLELPLSTAQQKEARSAELRPVLGYSTGVVIGNEQVSDLGSPYTLPPEAGRLGYDGVHINVPLDIIIPIPLQDK